MALPNQMIGAYRETKDIRQWLGSHTMVVVMVVSLAPTPGRGHAHLLPTTSTMLAPRRARFLLKKLLSHWLQLCICLSIIHFPILFVII